MPLLLDWFPAGSGSSFSIELCGCCWWLWVVVQCSFERGFARMSCVGHHCQSHCASHKLGLMLLAFFMKQNHFLYASDWPVYRIRADFWNFNRSWKLGPRSCRIWFKEATAFEDDLFEVFEALGITWGTLRGLFKEFEEVFSGIKRGIEGVGSRTWEDGGVERLKELNGYRWQVSPQCVCQTKTWAWRRVNSSSLEAVQSSCALGFRTWAQPYLKMQTSSCLKDGLSPMQSTCHAVSRDCFFDQILVLLMTSWFCQTFACFCRLWGSACFCEWLTQKTSNGWYKLRRCQEWTSTFWHAVLCFNRSLHVPYLLEKWLEPNVHCMPHIQPQLGTVSLGQA